ncbi:MAG: hypothetical protein NXY57DRAFT_1065273, partial [Lentinula lateritia]
MLRRCVVRFPAFVRRYTNEDIFEPYQEYTSPRPPPPQTSLKTLHNLLKTLSPSTYGTTRTLLLDLLSPSIALPIPPSPLFLSAALMAFHPSLSLSSSARISDFQLWFSYYPPLHPAPLSLLHTHLKSTPKTSLAFYTTLSVLLAGKGYISFSNRHLLPSISRYSSSGFEKYYRTYESSIESYFSTLKSPSGLHKTLTITRSIAIRFLAEAGHLDHAVSLLSPKYSLNPLTHSILLSRLLASPPSPTRDLHISKLRGLTRNPPRSKPISRGSNNLRSLSRSLLSPDPRNFPPTHDLVNFFTLYISLRDVPSSRNAISLLHTRTLRLSPIPFRAISHLLFAHMVLLFRLGTRGLGPSALRALLDLFLRFFHIHGVSPSTLLQYTTTDPSTHFYLTTLASLPQPLLPKLFPSRLHISLIWQSLAHLAPSHHALIELYNELISHASPQPQPQSTNLQTPQSWTSRGHRLPSNNTPYPPLQWHSHAHPSPIIAECFTPFIIKLMHASTYPTSPLPSPSPTPTPTSILRTLLSLSLSPTIYHYTEMARWWAWQGHESKVWIILDRLEGLHKDHQVLHAITISEDVENPPPLPPSSNPNPDPNSLPPPDLPFYIALMRAFLSSPNYSASSPSPASSSTPSSSSPSSPPSSFLPPFPPSSPYPGTLRRLSALSHLWTHMELRFGRAHLLEQLGIRIGGTRIETGSTLRRRSDGGGGGGGSDDAVDDSKDDDAPTSTPNPYLQKAVSNWRTLAGIPSPQTRT